MNIQNNIKSLKTSATLAINELSKQLIEEGKEVFMFGLGQSPFPVPKVIVDELKMKVSKAMQFTDQNCYFDDFAILFEKRDPWIS